MKSYVCALTAVALSVPLVYGATDPFVGTWRLNVRQSRYAPGACPKRMVIEMEAAGDGIRYRSETTHANGNSSRSEYTAEYNGKEAIVTGTNGLMTPVSLKRVERNVVVASYMRALQVLATSRRVVSGGGRVMTITTVSKTREGKVVTNVGVYDRSPSCVTEGKLKIPEASCACGVRLTSGSSASC